MNTQTDLFNQPSGETLRDLGMSIAAKNAERVCPGWNETAYNFFIEYAKNIGKPFMTNDVVEKSKGIVPDAPDGRAWGQIPVKAKKAGLIIWVGYSRGTKKEHHMNPRSLWQWKK